MNAFDRDTILFLNSFARRSWTFDWLVYLLDSNYLLKGGVPSALLTWAWFRSDGATGDRRARIVSGLIATCAAVIFARMLSLALPFRGRAINDTELHFSVPYSMDGWNLNGWWTSFPSDNAVLFFALATTVFVTSRRAGILAFLHVFVTAGFARVYLGYHHPTDIIAGAVIGAGFVYLAQVRAVRAAVTRKPIRWLEDQPQFFYPVLFILLLLVSTVFDPVFSIIHVVREVSSHPLVPRLVP